MHTSELYVSAEKSFNQVTLLEAKLVSATDNSTKLQVETTPYGALILAPVCFMIVWASVVFIVAGVCKVTRDRDKKVNINLFKQFPCTNCRFFINNHYLQCAVHPSTALTKQALNCSDYWPQ